MTVLIRIPVTHWGYTNGEKQLALQPGTMAKVIAGLHSRFPDLQGHLFDNNNRLLPGIELEVNGSQVFDIDSGFQLEQGDQVRISSIITGG